MKYTNIKKGTVLVYTLVLVILGVFMATVVLNIATELSVEYEKRNIEVSLINIIDTKGDLAMKYSSELNEGGNGFVDIISCPDNVTLSGSVTNISVSTTLRHIDNVVQCMATTTYNGEYLKIFFNSGATDINTADLGGYQVIVNSGSLSGVFSDGDSTFIDINTSSYFSPDDIDDNFDSDNYSSSSTGSIYYPDSYEDNDSKSRKLNYGYIIEGSGLFNVFWSNLKMKQYIHDNSNNLDPINQRIGTVGSGALYLDIAGDHKIVLYRIDSQSYNDTNELIFNQRIVSGDSGADVGYLQNDLTLDSGTGSAYEFDFINNDYSLFIENIGSGALLYQINGVDLSNGKDLYIVPLQDDEPGFFSFLGSHMLVDQEGKLVGDQLEVFGLK